MSNSLIEAVVDKIPDLVSMGGLTIISNIYGNPAVSIPAGTVDDLPIGMQVLAPHHRDADLFDIAFAYEREIGWPKVAPSVSGALAPA
jgi:aspartyl-tRNA(Asn)/glutamyl-tRNA(Gln) amidotransferase subunit A